jgi:tripartite-type tricarboxylate transporter receptor subunit TctC
MFCSTEYGALHDRRAGGPDREEKIMKAIQIGAKVAIAACLSAAALLPAVAQDYPSEPVTLIVPFAAGGPTDVASRIVAEAMSTTLGQPVVVDNRPGASSMIGASLVAEAANDGYTLLIGTTSTYATNPHVFKSIAYDATAFAPVALVVKVPLAFAVRKDMPVDTVEEFIAFAKAEENPLQYGSAGAGTHSSLACFLAAREIGVEMQEIPYQGTAPALTDLMAGNVDALCDSVGTLSGPLQSGQIKVIGELDAERSTAMADVPTFVESGFDDLVINNWFAVAAPAGTPEDVVAKVSGAIEAALADEAVATRLKAVGFVPEYMGPADLGAFMALEYERWDAVVEEAGISLE